MSSVRTDQVPESSVRTAIEVPFCGVTMVCDALLGAFAPDISFAWATGIKLTALISYPAYRTLSKVTAVEAGFVWAKAGWKSMPATPITIRPK